jgi:lysophospholipase L1-like esterase
MVPMRSGRFVRLAAIVLVIFQQGCHIHDINGDGIIHVAIVGDSNADGPRELADLLGQMLQATGMHEWRVSNHAAWGATIVPRSGTVWANFPTLTSRMLAAEDPDVVVYAGGTNDAQLHTPAAAVVSTLLTLQELIAIETAHAGGHAVTVVGLVPYHPPIATDPDNALIDAYNAAIIAAFPRLHVVALNTIVDDADYADGAHFTEFGHVKRARALFTSLTHESAPW